MDKFNISLIVNCNKEDMDKIDKSIFNIFYNKVYFNIFPENKEYFKTILNIIETQYYSIWDYNDKYENLKDLDIFLNKNYKEQEHIFNPEISVIVCVYNTKPELFKKCIDGLVSQTFKNFEVIVVNDGSDKYYNENRIIIENLKDNRFIWIDKEHSGKSQTLNLGIKKAKGRYIAINDSDDISYENRLEYQYNWLICHNNFDYISNNMIRMNDLTIFPNNFMEQGEVNKNNIHYCTNHPCSMFKYDIIHKIPFLFSQFYDSYEDCIFHYICFYYGVKMYYDNEILLQYNYDPQTQVHFDNICGFKHYAHYKITWSTFNIEKKSSDFGIYLILFDNNIWTNVEIEKTLLNIRISSNNVNIYILYNDCFNLDIIKNISDKYGIEYYKKFENIYNIFNNELYDEKNKYIGIISKPVRFYQQEWDLYIHRKLDIHNTIIQPLIFNIQKLNDNTYLNESGKNNKEYNYGERLTPLCEKLTEPNDEYYILSITNEYLKEIDIPLISNDNIFFITKEIWFKILEHINFKFKNIKINKYELSNVFISYILYNIYNKLPKIDLDNEIGTIYTNDINKNNYYFNYKLFVYSYLNETIYLHDQLFKTIKDINLPDFENYSNINNFLKIQNKQPWNL